MAEAPAKDAIGSGKSVVEGGTSAEGGASAPKKTIEFPKIVYRVLTPGSTALVPGVAPTYPTCGLEDLLRQAKILQGNSLSFGKLLVSSVCHGSVCYKPQDHRTCKFCLPFAFYR